MGSSFAAMKANAWFDDFDWDKLFNRELKPPVIFISSEILISSMSQQKRY